MGMIGWLQPTLPLQFPRQHPDVHPESCLQIEILILAAAYWTAGRADEGLGIIQEALAGARMMGLVVWEPELLRLEGELRLATSSDVAGALECFRQALA
jgi:hypothetical protein